jgi:pilus assembly protein FimV
LDKNKIIEAAAKLVAKGAFDKAIKEYQKILEVDPKDVRILQKMGELYQKKNEPAQAAQYFTRVAESYTSDGFFLKAVALYKQVLKLDPSLIDVNIKLAELHQQLQLHGEAMAYFQIVANHHDKQGDTRASLEILKKMVELDPDNVASRVKLADLYVREGQAEQGKAEFARAAEHLKRANRIDDYLRVAERLSAMDPNDLALARELAELYLQRSDQKRALAKLQLCFKADSRDIDTLRLLAVAFEGLGQTSKTISVHKELARAYEDRGQQAEAEQVWVQVERLDPNDPDVQARQAARAPEPAPVPRQPEPPAPAYAPQAYAPPAPVAPPPAAPRPRGDNISKLLTETDVYVKYGLHDKALEHLRKVFAVDPENIDAHEKAYAIYVVSSNFAQAFEQLLNVLRLHTRTGDAQRAQPYLTAILQQNPGHPEVPVFIQALGSGLAPGVAEVPTNDAPQEEAVLVDSTDDDLIVADDPSDEVISAEVSIGQDAGEFPADVAALHHDDSLPPPVDDAYAADELYAPYEQAPADEVSDPQAPPIDEFTTGEFDMSLGAEADDVPTSGTGIPVRAMPELSAAPAAPQGLGDEQHEAPTRVARRVDLALLRPSTPAHAPAPPVEAPLPDEAPYDEGAAYAEATSHEAQAEEVVEEAPGQAFPTAPELEAVEADEPAAEECDEASFFLEQGLYEEAREILETIVIAYPEHRRAAQLMAQLEAAEAGQGDGAAPGTLGDAGGNGASSSAFDLASELASELGDFPEAGVDAPAAGPDGDYQVSVEEVFSEFKKGLEKVVKPEDVDTHYDLGVAYKEMGLIDDAVSEFAIARRGCAGKRKEVDCLSMIGLLQSMKGDHAQAVEAFVQALQTEHATGDTEKALRYDLAAAWEGAGQAGKALGQYLRVQALDGTFRDVAAHVERLSALTAPEDEFASAAAAPSGRPPGGAGRPARKVGYV